MASRARATMCIRSHEVTIPYGVVQSEDGYLTGIAEKPSQSCFINAGIYVLAPELIAGLAPGEARDMPEIVERAMGREKAVALFPIREYWMDIGHLEDFKKANQDFPELFPVPEPGVAPEDEPRCPRVELAS